MASILHAWDENSDGTIDLLEFSALVRDLQVFAQFDRDCSGAISAVELRAALRKLGGTQTTDPPNRANGMPRERIKCLGCTAALMAPWSLSHGAADLTALQAQQMLDKYDDDKSGQIELSEFRRLAEDLPSLIKNLDDQSSFVRRKASPFVYPDTIAFNAPLPVGEDVSS